jgi:hypothetical protein
MKLNKRLSVLLYAAWLLSACEGRKVTDTTATQEKLVAQQYSKRRIEMIDPEAFTLLDSSTISVERRAGGQDFFKAFRIYRHHPAGKKAGFERSVAAPGWTVGVVPARRPTDSQNDCSIK